MPLHHKKNKTKKTLSSAVLACTAILGFSVFGAPAFAQTTLPPPIPSQVAADPNMALDPDLLEEFPTLKGKERISNLAQKWRNMTNEEKLPYEEKYKQEKESLEKEPEWIEKESKKKKSKNIVSEQVHISSHVIEKLTKDVETLQKDLEILRNAVKMLESN